MNRPEAHILSRLSLSSHDRLEEQAIFPAPAGAVSHALSDGTPLEAIAATREELWRFAPLEEPCGIARWSVDPGVYLVELAAEAHVAGRCAPASPSLLVLDAREQPAWVRMGDLVWKLDRERATRARVVHEAPLPELHVPPVQLEMFVRDERPAPWLAHHFRELASRGDPLSRVMAAGLVARLWTARDPDRGGLERLLAGEHPAPRALAWWRRLDRATQADVERHAMYRTRDLREGLFSLVDAIGADPPSAPAIPFLHARDDLQSVLHLLRALDAGAALARALDDLDRTARAHAAAWSLVPREGDPRLRAAAAATPDVWWGPLAL